MKHSSPNAIEFYFKHSVWNMIITYRLRNRSAGIDGILDLTLKFARATRCRSNAHANDDHVCVTLLMRWNT